MITRRRLLGWGTAMAAAAIATKTFALRLPRLGSAAQLAKKIYFKGDPAYEIQRRGATFNARKPNRFPTAIVLAENVDHVIRRRKTRRRSAEGSEHALRRPQLHGLAYARQRRQ